MLILNHIFPKNGPYLWEQLKQPLTFVFHHLQADRDKDDFSDAKSTARQDDILAVCKLHGNLDTPTVQNQLQALDKEYQLLKEQGQSSKADYVQTLYIWLSKKTGKVTGNYRNCHRLQTQWLLINIYGRWNWTPPPPLLKDNSAAMQDEETSVHRALMKYLDAWSLSPDSWEYNLHVGRLLLLQGRSREALQHLQSGLALRPLHPALRSGHRSVAGNRRRLCIVSSGDSSNNNHKWLKVIHSALGVLSRKKTSAEI